MNVFIPSFEVAWGQSMYVIDFLRENSFKELMPHIPVRHMLLVQERDPS
jgi:hypothetical protein